uniref:Uncharacterized protein n=1 Tax=Arundo donax TaxID=35708 RepID=A0A0A9SSA6_ARUDO
MQDGTILVLGTEHRSNKYLSILQLVLSADWVQSPTYGQQQLARYHLRTCFRLPHVEVSAANTWYEHICAV